MSKITQFPATSTQYNVWWYTSNWRLLLFYNAALNAIGHFRVPPGLCIKTMLSARPLICKWFFNPMRIKLIFTRKVVHLEPHIESEGFWNSEMAYCPSNRVFFFKTVLRTLNEQWRISSKRLAICSRVLNWQVSMPYMLEVHYIRSTIF